MAPGPRDQVAGRQVFWSKELPFVRQNRFYFAIPRLDRGIHVADAPHPVSPTVILDLIRDRCPQCSDFPRPIPAQGRDDSRRFGECSVLKPRGHAGWLAYPQLSAVFAKSADLLPQHIVLKIG